MVIQGRKTKIKTKKEITTIHVYIYIYSWCPRILIFYILHQCTIQTSTSHKLYSYLQFLLFFYDKYYRYLSYTRIFKNILHHLFRLRSLNSFINSHTRTTYFRATPSYWSNCHRILKYCCTYKPYTGSWQKLYTVKCNFCICNNTPLMYTIVHKYASNESFR